MKKKIETKKVVAKKSINRSKAISVMGTKKFNAKVAEEIQAGIDPNEAPDLIARRKLKGII